LSRGLQGKGKPRANPSLRSGRDLRVKRMFDGPFGQNWESNDLFYKASNYSEKLL
jgi:hypothetical protein